MLQFRCAFARASPALASAGARRVALCHASQLRPRHLSSSVVPPPPPESPPTSAAASEPGAETLERALALLDEGRVGTAIDFFAEAAKAGSSGGNFFLGLAYDGLLGENANGELWVTPDPAAGFRCYTRASEAGHAEAMLNLALCYRHGEGVARSVRAALEWTERAAAAGSDRAMFNAGVALDPLHPPWGEPGSTDPETRMLVKNPTRAVEFYRMAVDEGHSKAKVNLGILLYSGTGCEKDSAAAVALWHEAKEEGVQEADFCLRNMEENPGELKRMFDER